MSSQPTAEFHVTDAYRYDRRSAVRWVLSHLWRAPLLPIIFLVTTLGMAVAQSLGALAIGNAFDTIASGADLGLVTSVTLLVAAAYVGYGACDIINSLALRIVGQRVERDTREELYIDLLGKSPTFHGRQRVGDLMARTTNDVQQIGLMIAPNLGLIMESLLALLVPYVTIMTIRFELLLVPVLFLIGFLVTLRQYSNSLEPIAEAQRAQFGNLNARLAESVTGVEVVQGFAQEAAEERRFAKEARGFRDLFVREGEAQARYLPLLVYGLMVGLAFGHALLLFQQGLLSVGQVIAYMALIETLRTPIFFSLTTFAQVQLGLAGARRILDLIEAEDPAGAHAGGHQANVAGQITFEHVSLTYGDAPVLRNLNLTIQPGETVAIVGQTGAGKTTLTKLVNRTLDASQGRVLVDGVDVREWSLDSLRSQIGAIEQDVFLFSRSIAENIAFGAREPVTREQIEAAATRAQAHGFIQELPQGYDTVIGERGTTLSGGQRQRIAIARAFLSDPRILILDDSTSALDSATEDEIQKAIHEILNGRTTLLITHRLSQIRNADRILVMKNGEVIAQGSHDDLMQQSPIYRRIFARN
ncbi:MAG: ABC transporter ATP-binding protein [Roseiflexaceae bacterium]